MRIAAWLRSARPAAKLVFALVAASVALAGVRGFAASFGTGSGGFGAGSQMVATCGRGMTFAYTSGFYAGIRGYAVNGIELSNIPDGCLGRSLSVTFYESGDGVSSSAVTGTLPVSGTTESIAVPMTSDTIDAGLITGVSVVVA